MDKYINTLIDDSPSKSRENTSKKERGKESDADMDCGGGFRKADT